MQCFKLRFYLYIKLMGLKSPHSLMDLKWPHTLPVIKALQDVVNCTEYLKLRDFR